VAEEMISRISSGQSAYELNFGKEFIVNTADTANQRSVGKDSVGR
jgi:hypothetical protein